jgi:transcriptional regulator with XRE-family HTH domain
MEGKRGRGRPLTPLDPDASASALLGAKLRTRRVDKGLTLKELAALTGFSQQHISEVERAKSTPGHPFIDACDGALDANGALLELLPAATEERRQRCEDRSTARRTTVDPALRCEAHSDAGEDVEPTNRRGLLGAGASAAAAIGLSTAAAPAAAREVDPELPAHLADLLRLLARHDDAFGPRDVLSVVHRELRSIAAHRTVARGELRRELLRMEARWTGFAAWLAGDAGDRASRRALIGRARQLAHEADDADMVSVARGRQAQWSVRASEAAMLAEDGLATRIGSQTRALVSMRAAHAHALTGDVRASARRLADAEEAILDEDGPSAPHPHGRISRHHVAVWTARCAAALDPTQAIPLYEAALREWPRDLVRDRGLHQVRLALACAAAGERDRAEAEGRKALALAQATKSASAFHELRQLGVALNVN